MDIEKVRGQLRKMRQLLAPNGDVHKSFIEMHKLMTYVVDYLEHHVSNVKPLYIGKEVEEPEFKEKPMPLKKNGKIPKD